MTLVPAVVRHALVAALALSACSVFAQTGDSACGNPFRNHYGPYDYRTASQEQKVTVDSVHFTPTVESLQGGNTSMGPGGDLSYTLNVFPNHHRALMSMMKFALRERTSQPPGSSRTIQCWFDRGERFRPDDAMVKVIHGMYLMQAGKSGEAVEKLEQARGLEPENPNVQYNLGLAYFDLKMYDKALQSAHAAYAAGFPLPGLRNKLQRAGKWRAPE